jgi:hypothetical protein
MDTEKINAFVDGATEDELFYMSAYVRHKLRGKNPATKRDLDERMRDMDAGQKVSLKQAWELHRALERQGL